MAVTEGWKLESVVIGSENAAISGHTEHRNEDEYGTIGRTGKLGAVYREESGSGSSEETRTERTEKGPSSTEAKRTKKAENASSGSERGSDQIGTVLHIESLVFEPGELTLVIGPNGAGKTTLLETMAGLRKLQRGRVTLAGKPLWCRRKLNRDVLLQFAISQQHSESQWFAKSVKDELLYSLRPYRLPEQAMQERINDALLQAGLPITLLDRDPWTLSGGQQRRLAYACLLVCHPAWLLLDEPTAGLDAEGVRLLCANLAAHKAAGHGAVIVTHDVQALWAITDRIVVIENGAVGGVYTADQWQAEREAGWPSAPPSAAAQPPSAAAAAAAALRAAGFALPRDPLAPAELAGAIAAQLAASAAARAAHAAPARSGGIAAGAAAAGDPEAPDRRAATGRPGPGEASPGREPAAALAAPAQRAPLAPAPVHGWARRDPRALWAAYLLIAAGILMQQHWIGVGAAAVLTLLLLWDLRKLLRPWYGAIKAYIFFILFFIGFSGLSFQPLAVDFQTAGETALRLSKLLLVMLLGLSLPSLISPLRLQRAIEQGLHRLQAIKLPVSEMALTVALIFRFIPLLTGEWGRFARIVHARGKAVSVPGAVPLRDLHRVVLPFLVSLLRLADQMSTALEIRGFGRKRGKITSGYKLRFNAVDGMFVAAAAVGLVLLTLASHIQLP
ncbi:ATP-binding cassette domain-containing protein [Paenibacillus abyssi]|uniref:ABC transporter domain-containing protein n=1 Tax=Paenibacillus abyssi TaxID=1340531 RepID=A0A917D640_9BACL|nr:ATP-binding cassette domain-containing protein [Paenibacillus abyssi]GGG11709.1 hypothetical protein GCM10010916_30710 [Paenibacillus abyssi]